MAAKAPPPKVVAEIQGPTIPSPKEFYNDFIQQRRPVILRNNATEILENSNLSTDILDRLPQLVASSEYSNEKVEVNCGKGNDPTSFSPLDRSEVVSLSFEDFWKQKTGHYMTTQPLPIDEEGRPQVTSWLTDLMLKKKIIKLRPAIMGNLIPMTSGNLWMGQGTGCSGLHHDFHDNLYCLVSGHKSIRLCPPEMIHKTSMVGTFHTLHSNGRIVYKEQIKASCRIRPDGALESVETIMELEDRKEEIEKQLNQEGLSKEDVLELEKQLDEVQEDILSIEMAKEDDDQSSKDEESEAADLFSTSPKRRKMESHLDVVSEATLSDDNDNDDSQDCDNSSQMPLNFCTNSLVPAEEAFFETIELNGGDVLYLPAGWFHEVTSSGSPHSALNYWYHPPDNDKNASSSFEKPYNSRFWARDWKARNLVE